MNAPRHRIPGVVYPPADVAADLAARGVLPNTTLIEGFIDSMRSRGDAIAVSTSTSTMTYAELNHRTDRIAAGLLASGLRPLDAVLFQLPNGPELVLYFVGCMKAGLIPVCTLLAHRENEIVAIGRQLGARGHIVPAAHGNFDYPAFAARCRAELPTIALTMSTAATGAGTVSLEQIEARGESADARQALAAVEHDPWQVAVWQLSGGTTGTPKVIPRMQNGYRVNLQCTADRLGFTRDDRMLVFMPMMHNAPFLCSWGTALLIGAEIVTMDGVDPKLMVASILARQPSWTIVSPLLLARTRGMPGADALWRSFRGLLVARDAEQVEAQTGVPAYPFFGMTEGVIFFGGAADSTALRYGSHGHPISADDGFRILAPGTETELPDGEIGEMVIRGPYTLHGYFNAEARNREAFTSDGWYRSGDLMSAVTIDGVRCVRYHGRSKDVVDRGGEKINCEEVEGLLCRHPNVANAAIVPMPDPEYGERACAFVVTHPPGHPLTLADLRTHLTDLGVAKFKWPERVEIVDALPMTASGKLSKVPLREAILARLQAEAAASSAAP